MQHAAQIKLGSAYVAVSPCVCIKLWRRMQCECSFTLQIEKTQDRMSVSVIGRVTLLTSDIGSSKNQCSSLTLFRSLARVWSVQSFHCVVMWSAFSKTHCIWFWWQLLSHWDVAPAFTDIKSKANQKILNHVGGSALYATF